MLAAEAAIGLLAGLASAAPITSSGTLVASFSFGDRTSGASGEPAGYNPDGLRIPGQVGPWVDILASSGSTGPVSGFDSQSGSNITFTYDTTGVGIQHNNSGSQDPRHTFWRMGSPWGHGPITWTLSGLDDSKTYDLIFMGSPDLNRPPQISIGAFNPVNDADGDDNFLGMAPSGGVITGQLLNLNPSGISTLSALQVAEVAGGEDIPEPAPMALLGLAACGLGGYVRRRRKA